MSMQHAQYVLLFLVLAVNSIQVLNLRSCMLLLKVPVVMRSCYSAGTRMQWVRHCYINLEDLGTTVASFPGQSESGLGTRLGRQYSVVKCTKYWVQNNADKVHVFCMYMYTKQ